MKKSIARLAAGSLLAGAIGLGGSAVLTPAANAAGVTCSPSTESAVFPLDSKARTKVSAPQVRRVGRAYVATVRLTATAGSATADVTRTICPDGSHGDAAVSEQYAWDVRGVKTKTISKRAGSSRKAARAARSAASKARAAFTRSATRQSADLASQRALAIATALVNRDLATAHIVYLTRRNGALTLGSTSVDRSSTLKVLPNGDLAITVARWSAPTDPGSVPCITKAGVWPNSFLGGGGAVTWKGALPTAGPVPAVEVQNIAYWPGISLADFNDNITKSWTYSFAGSGALGALAAVGSGVANQKATPSSLLCFKTSGSEATNPPGTFVIHGFKIGTGTSGTTGVLGARTPLIVNAGA